MSIALMAAVFKYGPADSPVKKLVLLSLADYANEQDETCYPSYNHIAERCSIARRTAISIVQQLEDEGWLSVVGRRTDKHGNPSSNIIKVHRHMLVPPGDRGSPGVVIHDHQHDEGSDPRSPGVVIHDHQGSDPRSPDPLIDPLIDPGEDISSSAVSSDAAQKAWPGVLEQLSMQMTSSTFSTWLSSSVCKGVEGHKLRVSVRNEYAAEWLKERLYFIVLKEVSFALPGIKEVEFVVK